MKSLKYLSAIAVLALAITPALVFGQQNTGTQGCCDLLDPYWTTTSVPGGVPLGPVYSTAPDPAWVAPSPGSSWINPYGFDNTNAPGGNYTYQETFTLTSPTFISGEFAADNSACISLNGSPTGICTTGGEYGFNHYTPFELGLLSGTNSLDFIVNNQPDGPTGLEVEIGAETPEPSSLLLFGTGVVGLLAISRRKLNL